MKIIVQKFGGTSLSHHKYRERAVGKVQEAKKNGHSVVVVVSAMGRMGDPYSTDTLRDLITKDYPNCSPIIMDRLMSCGEIISASLLASYFDRLGEKTVVLTGGEAGIITDEEYGSAEIVSINTEKLLKYLDENYIVVVCGFQGITKDGSTTTLGRGGSDTTATALAVALKAEYVEIYTDVDGIMTADPNVVPTAKVIDEINYDEMFQLAEKGARVIHPRAVEIAKKDNLLVKIKNTLSNHSGTLIHYYKRNAGGTYSTKATSKLLTAITQKNNVAQVTVSLKDDFKKEGSFLFQMAEKNISIDMINFFVDRKIFTIDEAHTSAIKDILTKENLPFEIVENLSKITIVGSRITGIPGVMAAIVEALAKEEIKILQSSDSHSTICCLVKEADAIKGVNLLHSVFQLDA